MNTTHNFDSKIHHRRSVRLAGYDYSQEGVYFITCCCKAMKCRFGTIENSEMVLNELGIIAYNEWLELPTRFRNIELDVFQIMPNHMHGIIVINDPGSSCIVDVVSVGEMVGAYKSLVALECLSIFKNQNKIMGKLWQRDYFEHIIRDERSYENIYNYIIHNPQNWSKDK